jgi:hypothetical protein
MREGIKSWNENLVAILPLAICRSTKANPLRAILAVEDVDVMSTGSVREARQCVFWMLGCLRQEGTSVRSDPRNIGTNRPIRRYTRGSTVQIDKGQVERASWQQHLDGVIHQRLLLIDLRKNCT